MVLMAVPLYRNMTLYGLVHNCKRSREAVHVFRVAQGDLDQYTRRHTVNSSDTAVAVHGLVSPGAGIFDIIFFLHNELKRLTV